jgi:hypothetical protein
MRRQSTVRKKTRAYAGRDQCACGWYDMRKQSTANLESVEFAQIVIRPDRCELEDLIEGRVCAGGLRIVKNKAGHRAFAIASL